VNQIYLGLLGLGACATPALVVPETDSAAPNSVLISDYRANSIFRFDGVTGELIGAFAAGEDSRLDRPVSARQGPDGLLYSAGFGRGDINRYDTDGNITDVFWCDTRLLEEPVELVFSAERLYVLGNDTKNLVEIDVHGRMVRELGYPTMQGAQDFVIDGGTAYVATEHHPVLDTAIQVWDLEETGELIAHFGMPDEIATASALVLHDGMLYVSDGERGTVLRFDPTTGTLLDRLVTGLQGPVEIDIGLDGSLYVLDLVGLHAFDAATGEPRGTLIEVAGGPLERPLGFTFVTE